MKTLELEINSKLSALLKHQFPERGLLSNFLTKLLNMDKVNVYRRVQNIVPFTLAEAVMIVKHTDIPFNSIFDTSEDKYRSHSYQFYWQDFKNMNEKDIKMGEDYITAIRLAAMDEDAEFGIAMNNLPLHVTAMYPSLYRFFMLKWMHEFSDKGEKYRYCDIQIPNFLLEQQKRYLDACRRVKHTVCISDETILSRMLRDIKYFYEIKLITEKEVEVIKNDLQDLVSKIEKYAITGCYPNGAEIDIYTTGLTFETTYTYLYSSTVKVSMAEVYTSGSMSSVDASACEHMRKWMQALKRTSVRITDSEKNRIKYLENQYRDLEKFVV